MITFTTILLAFGLAVVGLIVHVIWWRIRRPRDDIRALILCMLVIPLILVVIWTAWRFDDESWKSLMGGVALYVLTAILGCTYIMSYPGAQAGSPSMLILLKLARHGTTGLSKEEVMAGFDDAALCNETFASLVNERFAERLYDRLVPAARGLSMLRVCQAWRAALGLKDGAG